MNKNSLLIIALSLLAIVSIQRTSGEEIKVSSQETSQPQVSKLDDIMKRHDEEQARIKRDAENAERLSKVRKDLYQSEIAMAEAEGDLIDANLEKEQQTKLSGLENQDKRKAIKLEYSRLRIENCKNTLKKKREILEKFNAESKMLHKQK